MNLRPSGYKEGYRRYINSVSAEYLQGLEGSWVGSRCAIFSLFDHNFWRDFWHIPCHFDEEFCLQLTAEKAVRRYSKGIPRIEYIKIRPNNEALDLAVLNLASFAMLNVNTKRVQRRLEDVRKPEPVKPQFPQRVMKTKPLWTRR